MRLPKIFAGCALSSVLIASQGYAPEAKQPELPGKEAQAVAFLCAEQNPVVIVLNQGNALLSIYGCDKNSPAHPKVMLRSTALWGEATKPGIYKNVELRAPEDAENYPGGVALVFNEHQAIHGIYKPEREARLQLLETSDAKDNAVSKGCINDPNFTEALDYLNKLISTGHLKKYPPLAIVEP